MLLSVDQQSQLGAILAQPINQRVQYGQRGRRTDQVRRQAPVQLSQDLGKPRRDIRPEPRQQSAEAAQRHPSLSETFLPAGLRSGARLARGFPVLASVLEHAALSIHGPLSL